MARILELRVGDARDALDRFEAAWNRRTEGRKVDRLRDAGPLSIYQLAKRLGRDYKNVHTDVTALIGLGLIERQGDTRILVPWDVVRAEF